VAPVPDTAYAELQVGTNYSFLRGASHVEELLATVKALGVAALAVTDHNTLAGIARVHARTAEVGLPLVVGCRLDLRDSLPVLAYHRPRQLRPAVPALDAGQGAGGQGRLRSGLGGPGHGRRRPAPGAAARPAR
jgi:error-prone DNA polymerase